MGGETGYPPSFHPQTCRLDGSIRPVLSSPALSGAPPDKMSATHPVQPIGQRSHFVGRGAFRYHQAAPRTPDLQQIQQAPPTERVQDKTGSEWSLADSGGHQFSIATRGVGEARYPHPAHLASPVTTYNVDIHTAALSGRHPPPAG